MAGSGMLHRAPKPLVLFVFAVVALIVAWPGIQTLAGAKSEDGFPLSNYPMFSTKRGDPRVHTYVRAVGKDDRTRVVKHAYWAWGGMNQAMKQIRSARGPHLQEFCQRAAKNVAKAKAYRRYKRVEIVRDSYRLNKYFGERKTEPDRRTVLARCNIPRRSPRPTSERPSEGVDARKRSPSNAASEP